MQTTHTPRTSTLEQRPPSSPDFGSRSWFPRRVLFFAALGLGVLAISVVGTGWVLHSHASDGKQASAAPVDLNKVNGFGFVDVLGRVAMLNPLQAGRVTEILVVENQPVKKGQVLLRLDSRLAKSKVDEAQADSEAAEETLKGAQLVPQLQASEAKTQQQAVFAAEYALAAAQEQLPRIKRLSESGVGTVSKEDYQAKLKQIKQLEAAVKAEQEKLAGLRQRNPQILINKAKSKVAGKRAQLQQAKDVLDEFCIKAPAAGTILRLSTSIGDLIGPTRPEPAIIFCPGRPEDRIIRAEIEQEFAGKVKPGMLAVVQDDARLSGRWEGEVQSVSDWFTHRRSPLLEPRQFNDVRTLECIIKLKPGQPPLRIGQRMRSPWGSEAGAFFGERQTDRPVQSHGVLSQRSFANRARSLAPRAGLTRPMWAMRPARCPRKSL